MDFSALNPVAILVTLIIAATPLLFAALGELVVEKSGVLNLGVEGMMIIGAIGGFATALETQNLWLAILAGAGAGAALAAIFALMTQYLLSNQVATGLALTMFGLGLASLLGQDYAGKTLDIAPKLNVEGLSDLPVVGPLLFSHDPLIYLSIVAVFGVWWFLNRTRAGLNLRAQAREPVLGLVDVDDLVAGLLGPGVVIGLLLAGTVRATPADDGQFLSGSMGARTDQAHSEYGGGKCGGGQG